jgi:hypothetical protein
MAITRYVQNVAIVQAPLGGVVPEAIGGGPLTGPLFQGFPVQLNDAGFELGDVKEVTAIYQMYGNESNGDIINIYLAQPGSMLDPAYSSVCQNGPATTLTLSVGDDDVTGYGVVSSGVAFGATPLPGTTYPGAITPQGASSTRYSTSLNVATGQTNPIAFTGGSSFTDPYVIGTFAVEPVGGPPGTGVSGSWIQATILTVGTPVAGKVLVFRLRIIKP